MSLRQKFNALVKDLRWSDAPAIGRDTLKDLTRPAEIFALAAGIVIPGGLVAYAAYRVVKFQQKKHAAKAGAR